MKKLQFVAVVVTFLLYGCSEQMSPVGPEQTSNVQAQQFSSGVQDPSLARVTTTGTKTGATGTKTGATGTMSSDFSTSPYFTPATITTKGDAITASKKIVAKDGGAVRLYGTFTTSAGTSVYADMSISFQPGDLPSDQTITISINKTTFAKNADVTFGPAGLEFVNPAMLSLFGSGVDVAAQSSEVELKYWSNGTWEDMPYSWGYYTSNFSGIVLASGKIPHFSRYAFGR
jgi:hypothetical protein